MQTVDYYECLGIQEGASAQQIKEAFRRKALEFHPDRNRDNPQAAAKMQDINEAYAVLSDPEKRRQYDMLRRDYGRSAQSRFRQTYSEQDIFRDSDIQQVFEEMARAFGLRGFDDLFKDLHIHGRNTFEIKQPGMRMRGFVFRSGRGGAPPVPGRGLFGAAFGGMARNMLRKLTGIEMPQRGDDIHDTIEMHPDFAAQGGAYPYLLRALDKRLVVHVPRGVRNGQTIRLSGMGLPGKGGAENGDLLLKVSIKVPLMERLKNFLRK
jgi:DnaJ-class molecular chaperone